MPAVETVLGPIDDAALGNVLSHEHVFSGLDRRIYPWRYDDAAARRRAVAELTEAKRGGVDTVIDLTTPDLGRDVTTLAELSRASGMNVVAATGIWLNPPNF